MYVRVEASECERERKREWRSAGVCERDTDRVYELVCTRERQCMSVCVRDRDG